MKLKTIVESSVGWVGPIQAILGSGRPYTLNYGTGGPGRPPFLYVPVPLSVIRSSIRHLERQTAWYDPARSLGGISNSQVNTTPGMITIAEVGRKLHHVGEAHFTVAMGPELFQGEDITGRLQDLGLCRPRYGIQISIHHTGQFKVLRSLFYKDEQDPEGPFLIAEQVLVPDLKPIRAALGLTPLPELPAQVKSAYIPHVTIGYVSQSDNVRAGYAAQCGTRPRHTAAPSSWQPSDHADRDRNSAPMI